MPRVIDNYTLTNLIGEGVYGKVYLAVHNQTNEQFAVKVVPVQRFKQNPKLQECTFNEIQTLSAIGTSSPHIVKFIEMLRTANNFYFVYEYCNGGTLYNLLKRQVKFPEPKALSYFKQLLDAFKVLYKNNIMHRDLKPENILFHNDVLKLGDFGFCKNLKEDNDMTATMLGSPIYMAPEVLKGQVYTSKADIWSLGVVLFEMLYGYCPFQTGSIANLIAKVANETVKFSPNVADVSEQTKNLIKRLLERDATRRIDWPTLFSFEITQNGIREGSNRNSISANQASFQQSIQNIPPWQLKNDVRKSNPVVHNGASSAIKLTSPPSFQTTSLSYDILPRKVNLTPDSKLASSSPITNSTKNLPTVNAKRKIYIEEHRACSKGIRIASQFCKGDQSDNIAFAYILLKKVEQRLKKVCDDVVLADVDYQDMTSTMRIEQRQLSEEIRYLKEELMRQNFQMKQLNDPKRFLCMRFRDTEPQLRLWYDMVSYLFNQRTMQQSTAELSSSQIIINIKTKLISL